jgi:hypothetical protein
MVQSFNENRGAGTAYPSDHPTKLPTVNPFGCTVEHLIDNTGFLNNIADVFAHKDDPDGALATSFAMAAAKAGRPLTPLPDKLVFVGHSAGAEAVEYVAERLHSSYPATFMQMRGIASEDGVKSFIGSNTDAALADLAGTTLQIYATASPHPPSSRLCRDGSADKPGRANRRATAGAGSGRVVC